MSPEKPSRLFCNRTHPCTYAAAKYGNIPQPRQACKAGIYRYSARSIKNCIQNKSSGRRYCTPTGISFTCSAECSCSRAALSPHIENVDTLFRRRSSVSEIGCMTMRKKINFPVLIKFIIYQIIIYIHYGNFSKKQL